MTASSESIKSLIENAYRSEVSLGDAFWYDEGGNVLLSTLHSFCRDGEVDIEKVYGPDDKEVEYDSLLWRWLETAIFEGYEPVDSRI